MPVSPSILVLGPSRWTSARTSDEAPTESPLQLRKDLVELLETMGCEATIMEAHEQGPDEEHFDLLLRVVEEEDVRIYLVFWPLEARLHGLEVELGHLLTEMAADRLDPGDVYLLAQEEVAEVDGEEGTVAWSEPGNRTRYHQDLVALGCPVRRWRTERGLRAQARAVGLEHTLTWG